MFDNAGKDIQNYAKVTMVVGIIASLALGIALMVIGDKAGRVMEGLGGLLTILGLVTICLGCVFSWIASLIIYAYGQNTCRLEHIDEKVSYIESMQYVDSKSSAL